MVRFANGRLTNDSAIIVRQKMGTEALVLEYVAAILLALGVLGGISVALLHVSGRHVPLWVGLLHGAVAMPGVIVLAFAVALDRGFESPTAIALYIFVLGALLGAVLFLQHSKRKRLARPMIAMHGAMQTAALIVLLVAIF